MDPKLVMTIAALIGAILGSILAMRSLLDRVTYNRSKDVRKSTRKNVPKGMSGARIQFDAVSFTQFSPSQADTNGEIALHFYVHLASILEQVKQDFEARRSSSVSSHTATKVSSLPFSRGTLFTVIPFVPQAKALPRLAEVLWEDDFEHIQFELKPIEEAHIDGVLVGEIRVFVGPIVVASVPFNILLDEKSTSVKQTFESTSRLQYKRIFVSYSHDDQAVVRAVDRIYRKHPEIETIIDYKFLQRGDYWWEEIKRRIEQAEALELFWSPSAAKSEAVSNEWHYALDLPRPILPIRFGQPTPEIPKELAHIHFEDFDQFIAEL